MRPADLVLGVDCSTTACKALIWDLTGSPIAEARVPLKIISEHLSWHEQSAEAWWEALATAIRHVTCQVTPSRLAALCITHQRETFVPVDEKGRPLRNGILWMDERARDLLPGLTDLIGAREFQRLTGKPLTGNLTVGKIAWIKENEPELFSRTAKYLDVQAFLVYCLTGRMRTGWGSADPTGLFDMTTNNWSEEILDKLGTRPDQFPEAFPMGSVIGSVSSQAETHCGLPAGLPVVAGIGDGQSCGLGLNVSRVGEAYLNLGTSVVSGTYSDRLLIDSENEKPAFRTLYGGIPGSYFLETALLGGGYTLSWLLDFIRSSVPGVSEKQIDDMLSRFEQQAGELQPGSHGLTLVPYWNSAMSPYWDASASGIVVGWRGFHRPVHLYRAILEGIAFEQYLSTTGVEAALGVKIGRFMVTGGGVKNKLWCRIVADVTGKSVIRADIQEAAALGAGILAASGVGLFQSVSEAARAMESTNFDIVEPDLQRHNYYNTIFHEVYQPLYPTLREILHRLDEFSSNG